jgi:hypothetical protein
MSDLDIECTVTFRRVLARTSMVAAMAALFALVSYLSSGNDLMLYVLLSAAVGLYAVLVLAVWQWQRGRRISVRTSEETVAFENFPIHDANTNVARRELVVPFQDITSVSRPYGLGSQTHDIRFRGGRVRIDPYLTRFRELVRFLEKVVKTRQGTSD